MVMHACLFTFLRGLLVPEAMMSAFRHDNEKGAGLEPPTRRGGRLSPSASIIVIAALSALAWAVLILIARLLYGVL